MDLVEKLDHVAFAVRDKERAAAYLTNVLGAKEVFDMEWGSFRFTSFLLGSGSMLELVYAEDPGSFVNRFIEKRGEGVHHLTFKVRDIDAMIEHLRAQGLNPFDINTENPLWKECYIHPREAMGTIIQYAEFPEDEWTKIWEQSKK